jgi:eukaryotic-like serine/threonine-protein kinase
MEGKTGIKEWVASKMTDPPPAPTDVVDPTMIGIPKIGDEILSGKYVIERPIGVGGMGVVLAARHKQLGQLVAIKFLSATMQTPDLVDRFLREGQAAVRIKSEHIAPVLDVGVLDTGTPYLMMEYLTGADLSAYLLENGALPVEEAVDVVLQACDALAVAHSAGIVHRDLKPSNLFMTQRTDGSPLIKVLDFGISKVSQPGEPDPKKTLTRPGMMLGSPRYMSPEQLRNASSVDHRADIWAIGVLLHELVAGSPPYDADTFAALCAMIASDPPTPIRQVVPDAPAELETILLKCFQKAPADRYQNVAELAAALAPLAPEESRVIASRVSKILGVTPRKGPASTRTKVSRIVTPRPTDSPLQDKTVPLESSDRARISAPSPLASTGAPSSSNPSTTPSDPGSALAVSHARVTRGSSTRAVAAMGLVVVIGAIAFGWKSFGTKSAGTDVAVPRETSIPEPATVAAPSETTPRMTGDPPAAPAPSATPPSAVHAAVRTKPLASRPAPSVSVSASAAPPPPPPPPPAPPSEADMLNRRR